MPVPQRVDFLVGSRGCASSPPKKGLLRMVQYLSLFVLHLAKNCCIGRRGKLSLGMKNK
ncbi:hypothetical protein QUB12_19390 [Microcoleus sp. B7-D4]